MTNTDIESQINKFSQTLVDQSLQFPIQLRIMTNEETKEYHRKKLYPLSLKSIGEIPQLDELTYEQRQWVHGRLKAPDWTWKRWFE